MDEILKRDENKVTVLAGVTDDSSLDIVQLRVNPTTNRLKVSAVIADLDVAGGGTGLTTIAAGSILAANTLDTLTAITSTSGTKVLTNTAGTISWETGGGGGATTALDNLAAVAINTTLVSDTYNTDALGTSAIAWSDLFLGTGSVIDWSSAASTSDMTLTHSSNTLTFAGGTVVLGTATATGGLTGDVTGNVSGTAATVTAATQTAITSAANLVTVGTVTTGTWGADLAADTVDAITEIASGLKTGADLVLVTGTAGTNGDLSIWNVDGDLVDGPTPPSGTIVGTTDTQTLSGKTLTAPRIVDAGFIADANGNEQIVFQTTTSAVNEIEITNAATGNDPLIAASGETNVSLVLSGKGTGIVKGELKRFMVQLLGNTTDQATATTIGGDFRISNRAITVQAVGAYVDTAGTTNTSTIDINEAGTTILSTKITIDSTEKSSETAATAPVISDSAIAADAIVTFDLDAVQTTEAKGLKVWVDYIYA